MRYDVVIKYILQGVSFGRRSPSMHSLRHSTGYLALTPRPEKRELQAILSERITGLYLINIHDD